MTYGIYLNPTNLFLRGFILLALDFTLDMGRFSFDFLPDWLGYLLIYWGIDLFRDEQLKKLERLTLFLVGLSFAQQFFPILREVVFGTGILSIVVTCVHVVRLYFYFMILSYLVELSRKVQSYHGEPLRFHRNVNLILETFMSVALPMVFFVTGGNLGEGFAMLIFGVGTVMFINWILVLYHMVQLREHIEKCRDFPLDIEETLG